MKSKANIVGYGSIILSLFILLNPNITLFDIAPDFIAYLILFFTLGKISNVIPHFEDARNNFLKLLWVSISKIVALFVMFSISSTHQSERSIIAVFSLAYAIIELIYIFPAFNALFDGFFYLEARFTENFKTTKAPARITFAFFVVKMLGCCLPEMALTSVDDRLGIVSATKINIANYYPWFSLFAAFITLIVGIVWIISFIIYIKSLSLNYQINHTISRIYSERYDEITGLYSHRFVSFAISLFSLGVFLNIDFIFDGKNHLPDVFSAIVLVLFAIMIRKYSKKAKVAISFGVAYTISTVISSYLASSFAREFTYLDIEHISFAKNAYNLVVTSNIIECVIAISFFFCIACVISDFIKKTTGYSNNNENSIEYNTMLHKSLSIRSFICASLGSLALIASVFYSILLSYTEKVKMLPEYSSSEIVMTKYGWFWIIPFVISVIWFVFANNLSSVIKEESERRHIL